MRGFTGLEGLGKLQCFVCGGQLGDRREKNASSGPLGPRDKPFRARSAGACPPRAHTCPSDRSSGAPAPERRMAKRTPSGPVARGPVPRDLSTRTEIARQPTPFPRPRHGEGQALALRYKGRFFHRSAGACPPRSFDPRENRTPTNAVFPTEARRGTGPRPTVKRRRTLSIGQARPRWIRSGAGAPELQTLGQTPKRPTPRTYNPVNPIIP